MKTLYELSEKEARDAEEWMREHSAGCHNPYDYDIYRPMCGRYSYIFTPAGIGTACEVRCRYCGATKDVTDISCW